MGGRTQQTKPRIRAFLSLFLVSAFCFTAPSRAIDWSAGGAEFSFSTSVGFGVFQEWDANFGAGTYDIRDLRDYSQGLRADAGVPVESPVWIEAFIKPALAVSKSVGEGTIFAQVSAVYATTRLDGDAAPFSTTRGDPGLASLEEAFIGYKMPLPFGWKGDSLVIKIGRQNFGIGDGFLFQLPKFNIGKASNFYLYPRAAFDGWGTIQINADPVRADIFVLRAPVNNDEAYGNATFAVDQPATHMAGFDIEWFQNVPMEGANGAVNYYDRLRYLNFTYFNVYKSDRDPLLYGDDTGVFWARRDGLHVLSLSGGGNWLDSAPNTTLHFQYARQLNGKRGREVDATAFYVEPGYTFSNHSWTPKVYYRYAYFSGQPGGVNDPIGTKRSYDLFFVGGGVRDFFGNWGLGEIIGNMMALTSNLIVQNVSLKVTPPIHLLKSTDTLSLQLLGFRYHLDKPARAGASSQLYGHEIDLAAMYTVDHTVVGLAVGVAIPSSGGRDAIAAQHAGLPFARSVGKTSKLIEFFVYHTF